MSKVNGYMDDPILAGKSIVEWDAAALLKMMWETWNEVLRRTLGFAERSLVSEVPDWRNKWAHQEPFSSDDAYQRAGFGRAAADCGLGPPVRRNRKGEDRTPARAFR